MGQIEPGVTLSGHLVSEEIGAGGYSRVFRATPVGGGADVAIKVAVRPELVEALRAEGAVLRRLQGPRFVKILEEHPEADPPYFVLEYCAGGDLRALLDASRDRRLPPQRVLALALAILDGVAFAHDEGVVHGDLKPENVLLDAEGNPKIADLGLSRATRRKLITQEGELKASLDTAPGKVRGTFDYLAPEVRRGGDVTPTSDVYALGVLLYELLTGARPLGLFRLPGEVVGREVPRELDRVVARALAHEARDRYPDASEMLADLRAGAMAAAARPVEKRRQAATPNPLLVGVSQETSLHWILTTLSIAVPTTLIAGGACWAVGDSRGVFIFGVVPLAATLAILVPVFFAAAVARARMARELERALEERT